MSNFDFTKVSKTKAKSGDPDWSNPVSFFYKLSHPDIRDLYPVQRDILQGWYEEFKKGSNDKMVSLNTGGGKTLIGLLIAESIRRETNGKVLYICPNNFLGKQTLDEADKYGIKVSSYLNLDSEGPAWKEKNLFLENNSVCLTNYHAVFNSRSIFKDFEIKGIIFDDAHLSMDLLDEQFTLRIDDNALIKKITDIFKSSPLMKEKITSVQDGDPLALAMIPPLEWHSQEKAVKNLLNANQAISESLQWINLKERINKTFCFVSARRLEISLLYPDIGKHFAFHKDVQRVYLSATLPNLDDITRVFGVTPSRIETNNPDYRPQRLFVFSSKTQISEPEDSIRKSLSELSPKVFVLVPFKEKVTEYKALGASVADSSNDVIDKIEQFRKADKGMLALANRYDGIDLPGGICHCLVVEGLPYTGSLKTRFFSEYFHNHKNSFLRSVVASKLIQAFGRTIRANNDYSIIFLLGDKLNSWVINKDNRKFFKTDLSEDIEIGASVSESLTTIDELKSLSSEILNQTDNWKKFFDERKGDVSPQETISKETEEKSVLLAQKERKIHDFFLSGNYKECLETILDTQQELFEHSKPILGLYLSIATVCASEIKDYRLSEVSARAYGISPIFGMPAQLDGNQRTLQAQRIIDFNKSLPVFDWSHKDKQFDENLKQLGDVLGFVSFRPEQEGDGTLDVCWEDEERKFVIGFENKVDKTNKTLTKREIDQCSGHNNWLSENYSGYKTIMFVVGEIESYHELASPAELCHLKVSEIERISGEVAQLHSKKVYPDQIDVSLNDQKLRIDHLFLTDKVSSLPKSK